MEIFIDSAEYELETMSKDNKPVGMEVFVSLTPMTVKDYQRTLRMLDKFGGLSKIDGSMLWDTDFSKFLQELLNTYCSGLRGIDIRDNAEIKPVVLEDLFIHAQLYACTILIFTKLLTISSLSTKEVVGVKK